MDPSQIDEIMREFGLMDDPVTIKTQAQQKELPLVRKSMPADPKINFKFGVGHPVRKQRMDSIEKQSIKLGAQGFPDTEYQPTLMDNEEATTYRMDMNLFPELKSEYNHIAQSEYPENHHQLTLKKNTNSFAPPHRSPLDQGKRNVRNPRDIIIDDITHGITIESILDPNFAKDSKTSFVLTLRIKYQTALGESLCVVGDIQELGQWKSFDAHMKWTEGHIWVLENLKVTSKPFFNYKYVLLKDNKPMTWEGGHNRIADLRLLPENIEKDSEIMRNINFFQDKNFKPDSNAKYVEIHDVWEQFVLRFSVFYPSDANSRQQLQIMGNLKCIGEEKHAIPMNKRIQLAMDGRLNNGQWLYSKYGQDIQPYELVVHMSSKSDEIEELPKEIRYKYLLTNHQNGMKDHEKMNERVIQVQKPETYKGMVSKEGQIHGQKVWIINGILDKVDGNFIMQRMKIHKIGETGICIGQFPSSDNDFQQLNRAGVKTIINLMTDEEMSSKDIKMNKIQIQTNQLQMKYVRMPIKDQFEDEYCYELFNQAKELSKIINPPQLAYIHCSSGVTRAPTLTLVYLCLFKKIEQWKVLQNACKYLMNFSPEILPNLKVVQRVIDQNIAFQNKNKAAYSQLPPKAVTKISAISSEIPQPKNSKPLPTTYPPMRENDLQSASGIDNKYFEMQDEQSMQDVMGEHPKYENSRPGSRAVSQNRIRHRVGSRGSRNSSAPWEDFNDPAIESDRSNEQPEQPSIKTPQPYKLESQISVSNKASSYRLKSKIDSQKHQELLAEQILKELEDKQAEDQKIKAEQERQLIELERLKTEEQRQIFEIEKLKIEQEKQRIEQERRDAEDEMARLQLIRQRAEQERLAFEEEKRQAELKLIEEQKQIQLRIQQEERLRLQEELKLKEEEQRKADEQRQLAQENLMKMIENKLRKEMEERLKQQNTEAEEMLKRKEEEAMLQIQLIKEQQQAEIEEKRKMKEVKKQMKQEEKERQLKQQEEERIRVQREMERQMEEMQKMRTLLEQEEIKRKQIEEQSQLNFLQIEQRVEQDKLQAQKEKEELLQKLKEAENKEKQELIKLRAIQEAMLSGSYARRLQEELQSKKDLQIRRSQPLTLNYEHGKGKEEVKFAEMQIGDISYLSGHDQTYILQQNASRFESSQERIGAFNDREELNQTAETNKIIDARTNYDEIENQDNNLNNSLVQDNKFENESAHTMPIGAKNPTPVKETNRQIEAVEAEAEVAQQKYITELARIAKIADQKRIQKLQQVELERQQSMARLKQKQELMKEIEQKKREAEEAEAAIRQLEEYDEQQQKLKREEQQKLIQEALRQAREEQEKRELEIKKKQDEERQRIEAEKQQELMKKENEINQLKELLEKQLKLQAQIEQQRQERERKEAEIRQQLQEQLQRQMLEKLRQDEEKKREEEERRRKFEEQQQILEAQRKQKAAEEAQRLQEEVERLERIKDTRLMFDAAMARVAGELIIQHVENQITQEYEDYKKQHEREQYERILKQRDDEKRLLDELQIQKQAENEKRTEMMKKAEEEAEKQRLILNQMNIVNRGGSQHRRFTSNSENKFMDQSEISNFEDAQDVNETIDNILKYSKNDLNPNINISPINFKSSDSYSPRITIGTTRSMHRESIPSQPEEESKNHQPDQPSIVENLTYENMVLYFNYAPPLPFKPTKGNEIEQAISNTLEQVNSKLPVVHIDKKLYLIGCNRLNCDSKFNQAFIKVGGGSQKLSDYLIKNEASIQKQLIDMMVKHQMQLVDLIQLLKQDKKLAKGVNGRMSALSPRKLSQQREQAQNSPGRISPRKGSQSRTNASGQKQNIAPYQKDQGMIKKQGSQTILDSANMQVEVRMSRFQTRPPVHAQFPSKSQL